MFAVLPFCNPGFTGGAGRFPQISGLAVTFSCNGIPPVVSGMWMEDVGWDGRHPHSNPYRRH